MRAPRRVAESSRHDLVDQPEIESLRSIDRLPCEQEISSPVQAHEQREEDVDAVARSRSIREVGRVLETLPPAPRERCRRAAGSPGVVTPSPFTQLITGAWMFRRSVVSCTPFRRITSHSIGVDRGNVLREAGGPDHISPVPVMITTLVSGGAGGG